jgi:hypothetical protein
MVTQRTVCVRSYTELQYRVRCMLHRECRPVQIIPAAA